MVYSVEFREAVAYSLSCLRTKSGEQHTPSRNQTSIRNGFQKEITVTPGILGQTSACALRPWQCLPGPVFPPVTLIKQGLETRLVRPPSPPAYGHVPVRKGDGRINGGNGVGGGPRLASDKGGLTVGMRMRIGMGVCAPLTNYG